ncbi:hypothetical protein NPIL_446721 [Nephila pilipes]|uniref:Uncharacterized protein n=1 Tax=Nephila pilipes TaxID=299642 RepID=A0A8X6MP36_NEPPI|nr:hypothetical protein NPIL_446721 [Nephila pilipes]
MNGNGNLLCKSSGASSVGAFSPGARQPATAGEGWRFVRRLPVCAYRSLTEAAATGQQLREVVKRGEAGMKRGSSGGAVWRYTRVKRRLKAY